MGPQEQAIDQRVPQGLRNERKGSFSSQGSNVRLPAPHSLLRRVGMLRGESMLLVARPQGERERERQHKKI